MRKIAFLAVFAMLLSIGGLGAAQAKRGGDNACPPPSPAFPNPDPPNCGKPAPPPPPPCQGTLAENIYQANLPVVGGVIVAPDNSGPLSTPVGNTVGGVAGAAIGRQAGCAVSLTGQ